MSTGNKKNQAPKMVRRMVPENAITWVPGTELPEQIQILIDNKIAAWAKDYDQQQSERLKNYRPPAPVELGEIVRGLFYQISGVYFEHGIEAVGLFIQELRKKAATRLKDEEGTLEMAKSAVNKAFEVHSTLEDLITGRVKITVPEKRYGYQRGGMATTDSNLNRKENGEALISKRATN